MNRFSFRGRAFTALLMVIGFAVLAVSGVILYMAPRGWAAHAFDWKLLWLGKKDWENVHIAFGLLFLIAAVFHIWMNRKPLLNYIRQRLRTRPAASAVKIRLEPWAALLLGVLLFAASVTMYPPVSYLLDWREAVSRFWQPEGATFNDPGHGPPPWARQKLQ